MTDYSERESDRGHAVADRGTTDDRSTARLDAAPRPLTLPEGRLAADPEAGGANRVQRASTPDSVIQPAIAVPRGPRIQRSLAGTIRGANDPALEVIDQLDNGTRAKKLCTAVAKIASTNPAIVQQLAATDDGKQALAALVGSLRKGGSKTEVRFAEMAIQNRFGLTDIHGFGPEALARIWPLLELLPERHVRSADNTFLQHMVGKTHVVHKGDHEGSTATIEYNKLLLGSTFGGTHKTIKALGAPYMETAGDALATENMFDELVLHEIGHSVDEKLRVMDQYGDQPDFGGWLDLVPGSSPDAQMTNEYWKDARTVASRQQLAQLGFNKASVRGWIDSILTGDSIKEIVNDEYPDKADATDRTALRDWMDQDLGIRAAKIASKQPKWGGGKGAWQRDDVDLADIALNGRMFHYAYAGTGNVPARWASYLVAQRAHKVSLYQWRAPGEWFAEIYANYFLGVLPNAHPIHDWFRDEIDQNNHLDSGQVTAPNAPPIGPVNAPVAQQVVPPVVPPVVAPVVPGQDEDSGTESETEDVPDIDDVVGPLPQITIADLEAVLDPSAQAQVVRELIAVGGPGVQGPVVDD